MRGRTGHAKGLGLRLRVILVIAGLPVLFLAPVLAYLGREYQDAYREAFWSKGDLATVHLRQILGAVAPFVGGVSDAPGLELFLKDTTETVSDFDFIALVDQDGLVLGHSRPGYVGSTVEELSDLARDAIRRGSDQDPYSIVARDFRFGKTYLIWRDMPMPGDESRTLYIVVGERASVVDPPVYPLIGVGALAGAGVVLLIWVSLRRLVIAPLNQLAEGAAIVGAGDLTHEIQLGRDDEFEFVAQAFNEMAGRLRGMVTRLEAAVAERTAELERRNAQLRAVSVVGQQAASEQNADTLLSTAARAISDSFGFYHVGIFITDDAREWAVLRAASSEGGQRMLSRGHRLRVGQVGIVGHVASSGRPRLAFRVGQDAVWFDNPDLPTTRSEMAVPLIVGDRVFGVLDVQSDRETAFTEDDVSTLQLMADQLTVVLNNARATEAMASALAELRDVQVDYGRRGWARVAKRMRPMAYEYDRVDTSPVPLLPIPPGLARNDVDHEVVMDGGSHVVIEPLRVGERNLGYVGLTDSRRVWTPEELALVRSVGEQVALALDNARLFEDTQRNERQQYLISRVLQVASDPSSNASEVLGEIARVLARGLDMAVVIYTFPQPGLPVAHAHAAVDPDGGRLALFERDLSLSREHFIFFQGLVGPELGPVAPLLGSSPREPEVDDVLQRFDFDRVLYVPITTGGTTSGFIGLVQMRSSPPLDPDTRELAHNLASQVAVVLENLNLSQETRQRSLELRELYLASLRLSEILEPVDVLAAVAAQGATLLGADAANLWIYDPEARALQLAIDYEDGAEGRLHYQLSLGQGLAGQALAREETIFVEDYGAADQRIPDLISSRFRAMMAVPLIGRAAAIGVLVVLSEGIGVFGQREAALADLFSAQASAAIENARLNQEAQRRAGEFSQLYDAGIDLITILDLDTLLTHSADWARRVFAADRAIVFLWESESGRYVRGQSVSSECYVFSPEADQPSPGGLTERIIEARETILVRDNRVSEAPSATRLVEVGLLSQMGTPLLVGDEVLGALYVNGAEADQFGEQDLNLLEFLATQISSALQNAIRFGQREQALAMVRRQARYQSSVSEAVARLNERGTEATSDVLRLMGQAAAVPVAIYFEAVEQDGTAFWRLANAWAIDARRSEQSGDPRLQRMPAASMPSWHDALVGQGYVMARRADLPDAEQTFLAPLEFESVLGLPVLGDRPLPGFVALLGDQDEVWQEQDVVALQTVAAALSNTLAREALFDQVQETLSETDALYRGSAALSEASTYQGILDVLLEHTVLGMQAQRATLHLFDRSWSGDVGASETDAPDYSEIVAYWPPDPESGIRSRYSRREFGSSLSAMQSGAPVFIEDLSQESALDRRALALFQRALGAQSVILLPLVVGGRRIGFMHADFALPQVFPGAARRRLVSLAQQASIAVLNLLQLRETEARVRREQLIRQISEQIQEAPDVQGVLQTAVRELGRAFGSPRSRIQFRAPGEDADDAQ